MASRMLSGYDTTTRAHVHDTALQLVTHKTEFFMIRKGDIRNLEENIPQGRAYCFRLACMRNVHAKCAFATIDVAVLSVGIARVA